MPNHSLWVNHWFEIKTLFSHCQILHTCTPFSFTIPHTRMNTEGASGQIKKKSERERKRPDRKMENRARVREWDSSAFLTVRRDPWYRRLNWIRLTERILAHNHNTLLSWYSLVYSWKYIRIQTPPNNTPRLCCCAIVSGQCGLSGIWVIVVGRCGWMQESWGGLANLPQSLEADGVTNYPIPSPQTLPAFQMAHLTLSDWHKGRVPGAGHTSSPMACVTVYTTPSQRH